MDDRRLDESLRRLPEARAGEGFTAAVLARLEALDEPAPGWWTPLPRLAATAVLLAAAVALGFWIALPPATAPGAGTAGPAVATAPPPAADAPAAERGEQSPETAAPAAGDPSSPTRLAQRTAPTAERPAAERVVSERLDREAAAHRLAELRRERERLIADLATLDAAERPTLVLGGDETVELVIDFAQPQPGGVRPASYRPN